jgi:N4-gp56 family major capsid protein
MAVTTYGVNDALAVKLWSKKLAQEALKATAIAPLIGEGMDSIIVKRTETSKSAGDRVTYGLRTQLRGRGVSEGQTLEGNEESLTTWSDALTINELNHAVRIKNEGTIDNQRILFNAREEAKNGLRDWYADRMSVGFFMQVCGYTGTSITVEGANIATGGVIFGFNAPTAPSTNRIIRAGAQATDQALTSGNLFDLTLIDRAVALAKTANPRIRPIKVDGADKYVMYLHPFQVFSMRTSTTTGQWLDITKAVYQGSRQNNPIYSGALGEYNGVILREAEHVTTGVNSSSSAEITTVRRAVLLGAQAATIAFGQGRGETEYKWQEETFDYERELGVAVKTIFGMKKCVFNNEDFGSIVVSTHAVQP